jgi:hypothetical protein
LADEPGIEVRLQKPPRLVVGIIPFGGFAAHGFGFFAAYRSPGEIKPFT